MKKLVILGIVMSLSLGFVACGNNEAKNKESVKNEVRADKGETNEMNNKKDEKFIYGKVKSIVGNEIEIELAKEPNIEIESTENEEEIAQNEATSVPATMATPAMQASQGDIDKKVATGKIEKNEPLVELEFINEFKTITVPTGAQVNILTNRSGDGLSAIKEGVYLKISVDDNTSENPNVSYIDIIS